MITEHGIELGLQDVVGASTAEQILGVGVGNIGRVAGMPEPVYAPPSGRLWLRSEIEALAAKRITKPARRTYVDPDNPAHEVTWHP